MSSKKKQKRDDDDEEADKVVSSRNFLKLHSSLGQLDPSGVNEFHLENLSSPALTYSSFWLFQGPKLMSGTTQEREALRKEQRALADTIVENKQAIGDVRSAVFGRWWSFIWPKFQITESA